MVTGNQTVFLAPVITIVSCSLDYLEQMMTNFLSIVCGFRIEQDMTGADRPLFALVAISIIVVVAVDSSSAHANIFAVTA
jgi:hypothetical protein